MKIKRHAILALFLVAALLMAGVPAMASADPAEDALVLADGETLTVSEDMTLSSLVIGEDCAVEAAEGYRLIMTADGVVVRPEAGSYENVVLTLQAEDYTYGDYDETGNAEDEAFRFLFNAGEEILFVESAFDEAVSITEEDGWVVFDGSGTTLTVNEDRINAIAVENTDTIIRSIDILVEGLGLCEYGNVFGAAISVAGSDSNVIVQDVSVTTVGAIMSTLNSSAGDVLVMDSQFNGYGTALDATGLHSGIAPYSNVQGAITEVPWVLGLYGSLRATNVIGSANVLYYNTSATSNGWGVYSTDGGNSIIIINSDASYDDSYGAAFNSLYGSYVLSLPSHFYGFQVDLSGAEENTYGIVARGSFTIGASSQENLEALDALINQPQEEASDEASSESSSGIESAAGVWEMFLDNVALEDVTEQRSVLKAKFGIMSHGASGGTFDITGTDIIADEAAILLKQAYMTILMDETVTIDAPIIIHQQITDDASMGEYAYDNCWATATAPFLYEVEDSGEAPASGANAIMTGMTLEGDFYNTDTDGAYLDLAFEGTEVTGVISSGTFLHDNASFYVVENPDFDLEAEESADNMRYICVDETGAAYESTVTYTLFGTIVYNPVYEDDNGDITFYYDEAGTTCDAADIVGYCIFYNDAQYCANGTITPCSTINNPVYVSLTDGSVWTVTGESYLAQLTVEAGSAVSGIVTVDGEEVDVSAGGTWEGDIVVAPAEGASVEAAASEGDWEGYIAYLTELVNTDPTVDIYNQLISELAEAQEEDYTGLEDGTMYGAINALFTCMTYEEYLAQ
ncbi:MAG: hypothetical protein LUG57_08520 [Oscillospiraceae bacterium]|nr:hypothetical protein [Oscillospiraceae bacterium]